MSKQVVAVIPEDVRVSRSTGMSQVLLVVEILVDEELAEQRYVLNLDKADAVGLELQRQSKRLRDDLAREAPLGKTPENDEPLH